jgi:hypothetical protein
VSNRTTPAQRWIGLGIAFVVILTLAGASILALRNNNDDNDNAGYIDTFQDLAADEGVNITDNEAACLLDVVDDYVSVDEYIATYAGGGETDFSDADETQAGLAIMSDCPSVVGKIFDADDSGEYDASDLDTAADDSDESATPPTTLPPTPPTTPPPTPPTTLPDESSATPPVTTNQSCGALYQDAVNTPLGSDEWDAFTASGCDSYDGDGIGCDALYQDALNAPEGPEGDDEWQALADNECIVGE